MVQSQTYNLSPDQHQKHFTTNSYIKIHQASTAQKHWN